MTTPPVLRERHHQLWNYPAEPAAASRDAASVHFDADVRTSHEESDHALVDAAPREARYSGEC